MLCEKLFNLMDRTRTTKAPTFFAMLDQHNGGETTHLVAPRQLHIFSFIHFKPGQQQATRMRLHHLLQRRGNLDTWKAPFRPEIHYHRDFSGALQDLLLKIMQGYIKDMLRLFHQTSPVHGYKAEIIL